MEITEIRDEEVREMKGEEGMRTEVKGIAKKRKNMREKKGREEINEARKQKR